MPAARSTSATRTPSYRTTFSCSAGTETVTRGKVFQSAAVKVRATSPTPEAESSAAGFEVDCANGSGFRRSSDDANVAAHAKSTQAARIIIHLRRRRLESLGRQDAG